MVGRENISQQGSSLQIYTINCNISDPYTIKEPYAQSYIEEKLRHQEEHNFLLQHLQIIYLLALL